MTPEEKSRIAKVYAEMQIGYAIAEKDRYRRIRETDTASAIESLRGAFRMAASDLPMRQSSGLIQYYEALKRVR